MTTSTNPLSPGTFAGAVRPGLLRVLGPAAWVALAVVVARCLYLVAFCPYSLVEDEAQYWLWAQYPGWSYYSKGPGVAWAIWASTRIFGDAPWAVRLPTALASGVTMLAGAALGASLVLGTLRSLPRGDADALAGLARRVALWSAIALALMPGYQLASILMTIDGAYVACWGAAVLCAWLALERGSRWAWVGLGLALGIGFLFKYTILLLVPGLVLYVLVRKRAGGGAGGTFSLARGWPVWFAICLLLVAAGLAPVLIWNAGHGWPTVKHLLGHVGAAGGDQPVGHQAPIATGENGNAGVLRTEFAAPFWVLSYIGTQFGVAGPWLGLAVMASVRALRRRGVAGFRAARGPAATDPAQRPGEMLLICAGAPILLFYLGVSLFTEPEGNWPIGAYVTLVPLAVWEFVRFAGPRLPRVASERWRLNPRRLFWHGGLIVGLIAVPVLHRADIFVRAVNLVKPGEPIVLGRMMTAPIVAEHVGELLTRLRAETGLEPMVMAQHYGRASQVSYELRLHPPAMSMSALMWGRKSHFDYWPQTDPRRSELMGRPAVLLSNDQPFIRDRWSEWFERIEPVGRLRGEHKRDRVAYVGYGYRGVGGNGGPGGGTP